MRNGHRSRAQKGDDNVQSIHDNFYVELFWSTEITLERDYTISVFLLDEAGQVITQIDSQPFLGERPTSSWQIGELIYDPKKLDLPQALAAGSYQIGVTVYHIENEEILRLNTAQNSVYFIIDSIEIMP